MKVNHRMGSWWGCGKNKIVDWCRISANGRLIVIGNSVEQVVRFFAMWFSDYRGSDISANCSTVKKTWQLAFKLDSQLVHDNAIEWYPMDIVIFRALKLCLRFSFTDFLPFKLKKGHLLNRQWKLVLWCQIITVCFSELIISF